MKKSKKEEDETRAELITEITLHVIGKQWKWNQDSCNAVHEQLEDCLNSFLENEMGTEDDFDRYVRDWLGDCQ